MKTAAIVRSVLALMYCLCAPPLRAAETLLSETGRLEIERSHSERREEVFSEYRKRLDERFRTSEEAGDIDLMVLISDERDAPGAGETPAELLRERDELQGWLLRLERKRSRDVLDRLLSLRENAGETAAPDLHAAIQALEEQLSAPILGNNVLPEDVFSHKRAGEWRILLPRGREMNRTGLQKDGNDGETPALRLHQDRRHPLLLSRELKMPGTADYELRWEARALSNIPSEAADQQAGAYAIGFGVSDQAYQALPPQIKNGLTRTVLEIAPAPLGQEWQAYRGTLQSGEHMDQLMLRISSGEAEWEIRSLQIRRIYSRD